MVTLPQAHDNTMDAMIAPAPVVSLRSFPRREAISDRPNPVKGKFAGINREYSCKNRPGCAVAAPLAALSESGVVTTSRFDERNNLHLLLIFLFYARVAARTTSHELTEIVKRADDFDELRFIRLYHLDTAR
jgi:hypothetical protein